jgi:hypothetical protein
MFNARKLRDNLRDATKAVVTTWEDREKLPLWSHDLYNEYFASDQFLKVLVTNGTPKKLTGLTLSIDSAGGFLMQVGTDGDLKQARGRTPLPLGDLQPKRTLLASVLTGNTFSTYTTRSIKQLVVLSCDEHVRIRYKFPAPEHIEFRNRLRRYVILNISWMVFFICGLIVFGMFASKH